MAAPSRTRFAAAAPVAAGEAAAAPSRTRRPAADTDALAAKVAEALLTTFALHVTLDDAAEVAAPSLTRRA